VADVVLPKWGVSMREGTVVHWHKRVGDAVTEGEPLADVVTDKVEVTLDAPASGVLSEVLVEEEETIPVGSRLAVIDEA
jgi:pyruvate/2-oxoglutarate dehydrogenase complex dihydrolipoamide acyltransferase (E2) component